MSNTIRNKVVVKAISTRKKYASTDKLHNFEGTRTDHLSFIKTIKEAYILWVQYNSNNSSKNVIKREKIIGPFDIGLYIKV